MQLASFFQLDDKQQTINNIWTYIAAISSYKYFRFQTQRGIGVNLDSMTIMINVNFKATDFHINLFVKIS